MRTSTKALPLALFVFAHPDDEFFCLPAIRISLAHEREVVCVYLTDGGYGGQSRETRMRESTHVLTKLGVCEGHVHFIGVHGAIPDGRLYMHLSSAYESLRTIVTNRTVDSIYCPAWEGGHQDHDACYAICIKLLATYRGNGAPSVMQFPLYNACHQILPFSVMKSLWQNGKVTELRISWREALKYLSSVMIYRSQWKTWAVLFPFSVINILSKRCYTLQAVSRSRLSERPHSGCLLYEKRGTAEPEAVMARIADFMAR